MNRILPVLALSLSFSICTYAQTEPASNPTNGHFRFLTQWGFDFAFNPAAADSFLVLKSEQPFSTPPVDGTKYEKGQWIGNAKVISTSKADSFHVREVVENTKYYLTVFAYNVSGSNTNYKQTGPLVDSLVSPVSTPGNYYQNVHPNSASFIQDLHNLINPHAVSTYASYKYKIQPNIWERDTTQGKAVSTCAYSGELTVYDAPITFGGNAGDYSKEHCLPQSWMTATGTTDSTDRADYHNLLITNFKKANEPRNNYPYGNVVTATYTYLGFKTGKDANNITVAEPRDAIKGDAARNMFYEMVCYNGNSGNWGFDNLKSIAGQQNEAVLKQWNIQDPPDKAERTKTEYIASIQFNRNPFIDHPDWVECINFRTITAKACVNGIADEEKVKLDYHWLTPSALELTNPHSGNVTVMVSDMSGRVLYREQNANPAFTIDMNGYNSGVYILSIQYEGKIASVKLPFIN